MTLLEQEILKSADNIQNNILEYDLKVGLALAKAYTKMNILKEYCEDESSLDVFSVINEYAVYCEASKDNEDDESGDNNDGEKSTLSKALEIPKRLIQALINFIHKILDNLDIEGMKKNCDEASETLKEMDENDISEMTKKTNELIAVIKKHCTNENGELDQAALDNLIAHADAKGYTDEQLNGEVAAYYTTGKIFGAAVETAVDMAAITAVAKYLGIIDDLKRLNTNIVSIFNNKICVGVDVNTLTDKINQTYDLSRDISRACRNSNTVAGERFRTPDRSEIQEFETRFEKIKSINYRNNEITYDLDQFKNTMLDQLKDLLEKMGIAADNLRSIATAETDYGFTSSTNTDQAFSHFWASFVFECLKYFYTPEDIGGKGKDKKSWIPIKKTNKTTIHDLWLKALNKDNMTGKYSRNDMIDFIRNFQNGLTHFMGGGEGYDADALNYVDSNQQPIIRPNEKLLNQFAQRCITEPGLFMDIYNSCGRLIANIPNILHSRADDMADNYIVNQVNAQLDRDDANNERNGSRAQAQLLNTAEENENRANAIANTQSVYNQLSNLAQQIIDMSLTDTKCLKNAIESGGAKQPLFITRVWHAWREKGKFEATSFVKNMAARSATNTIKSTANSVKKTANKVHGTGTNFIGSNFNSHLNN